MVSSEGTCKIWHEYGGHVIVKEEAENESKFGRML
jgi:hypothetical protein